MSTARAFRLGMTATADALAAGDITAEQATAITAAVCDLPGDTDPDVVQRAETTLLAHAADHEPTGLTRLGRRILEVVDPDRTDARLGTALEREAARAARCRGSS